MGKPPTSEWPGEFTHSGDESVCKTFVQTWAETVIRQVQRVKELRVKAARDGRNYERDEDCSPTVEVLAKNFRAQWAEEQTLVWAAYQLERWGKRLAEARRQEPPASDKVLKRLREALEHLDDAEFSKEGYVDSALPGEDKDKNRGLRALPSSSLSISTPESVGPPAFGLIDVEELERRAEAYARQFEDEMLDEAESYFIDMERDR